jgi:hypothetical protein
MVITYPFSGGWHETAHLHRSTKRCGGVTDGGALLARAEEVIE